MSEKPISLLRQRMIEDMMVRNFGLGNVAAIMFAFGVGTTLPMLVVAALSRTACRGGVSAYSPRDISAKS
jgi:hypothetical protein